MLKINSIVYSSSVLITTVRTSLTYWGKECINCNKRSYDIHAARAQQCTLLYSNYKPLCCMLKLLVIDAQRADQIHARDYYNIIIVLAIRQYVQREFQR